MELQSVAWAAYHERAVARFEKIGTPDELLEALRAHADAAGDAIEAEAAAELARAARRKRSFKWLGGAFVALFVGPILLAETGAPDAVGIALVLGVFCAFGYGAYLLFGTFLGRAAMQAPSDDRRFSVAQAVLETLRPELADKEATMWVVSDPISQAEVTERKRRGGGGWLEVRTLDWLQLEARAGDGALWTITARIVRREKSKPKRGGTKRRVSTEERVRVQLGAKAPLPAPLGQALGRLAKGQRQVSKTLQVARARARPRRAEVELVLDSRVRNARANEAGAGGLSFAAFLARDHAQLKSDEILLGAALLGRLKVDGG